MSTLVVTGTGTGVGKTVATAALACHARLSGIDVAICKPVQTGSPHDDDLADIARLSGVTDLHGSWRYPEPLAPAAAAQRAGMALPTRAELAASVREAGDGGAKLVLVEGAGGLLVELGQDGVTLRDIATDVAAPVLIVVAAGLGTLNHTALTLEALASQGIPCAGLIVGAWPSNPGPAEDGNREALSRLAPLRAVLPAGLGTASAADFETVSASAFDPAWVAGLS
ncbi:dethiobiotin synthase [Mycobacterium sp. 2YAF39]|uniref:dethiobiotin synthase n=1 Tax=Mycobacterium sp. 2YAF39 TaxID=3233033 RepID=UPI003F9888B7